MKEAEKEFIKSFISRETLEMYEGILEVDCSSYAEFIADGMLYSFEKSRKVFLKDKIGIMLNNIIYYFNCLLNVERKDKDFESIFRLTKQFIKDFQMLLKDFKNIILTEENTPELIADLYLYYFAILDIYNCVFSVFDAELKHEELKARDIRVFIPNDKTLEENLSDFETISKFIRALKKDN